MGYEQNIDLEFKKTKDLRIEAEKRWGLTNNAFWLTKGINGIKAKKDGVWTKYDFDVSKWIWGKEEEKLWGLNEVWIWLVVKGPIYKKNLPASLLDHFLQICIQVYFCMMNATGRAVQRENAYFSV